MEEEKELFEEYEVKHWEFTPRFYKIIGSAVVIQFLVFAVIGQFNLLQTRACDNPIAGKVCDALDALYVGSAFLDNKEWANTDVVVDKFKEAEITYVDVTSDEPPFTYPEGYFALVNPEELITNEIPTNDPLVSLGSNSSDFGSPTPPTGGSLIDTAPKLPKQNKAPVKGEIDNDLFGYDDEKPAKTPAAKPSKSPKNESPTKLPPLGKDNVADNKGDKKDDKDKKDEKKDDKKDEPSTTKSDEELAIFQPNKKPLLDLRDDVKEKIAKNEVDLKAPFSITIDGVLTQDGKLDVKKTRFTNAQGDPKMIDLAKSALEAVNASGLFIYLDKLGGKRIIITLQQDKDNISVVIKSQVESDAKARSIASGFNFLIGMGKDNRKGKDEEILLNGAKVTSEGKDFLLNFALPQQVAQDLIQKQLKDASETEKKTEPSGLADGKNTKKTGDK